MTRFIQAALFFLASIIQFSVAVANPLAPTPLNGQWRGPLKLLGGEINIVITIVPLTNGTYYAALDAPQQRISRMPVEVEVKDDNLTLRIEQAGSSFVGKIQDNGATFSGTWKQPGVTAPMVLKQATASTQAATKFKATPPYRQTDITFTNPVTKHRLAGTLTVPAGEGPFAGVVLLSDSGPQSREVEVPGYRMFGQLADYLTRHGVAVLRFDDRGVGKSGGTYASATTADLVTDAQAALAQLRATPLVAAHRVGLLGHGEGANVALLAAAGAGRAPAFVVSLAGYGQTGYDVLLRQQGEIMRLIGADPAQVKAAQEVYQRTVSIIRQTPDNAAARTKVAALLAGANLGLDGSMARARAVQLTSPWARYFFDFDPQAKLDKVQCSVLLLNGTADLQVSARRNMTPLYKALRHAKRTATSYKLTGVNHLFQAPAAAWPLVNGAPQAVFSPEALKLVHSWVARETTPPGGPLPVTVKRPGPSRKVNRTPSTNRTRS
ncbi:alpha/beta hydrolase family protein [Hymenobacter properus]|uniref:Alpha/beta hydrolase n=1 Tax=Hymenobacter properus TaxID=2791026 RepID=A0A931FIX4_9BACT|nr:alpha/beta hydrolase [Hymenobacter properus]MBF9142437.1 alpha/beta hydrolase [Hymenobacter properus]MBR7721244.1 alpha/beta hydrolase [Microvirga sp. SRT04]